MADFNEYSQKGAVLMQQALKKYAEGDFEGGDKDRQEANRYYDLMSDYINSDAGKLSMLYGESRNFGIIYNVFEQNFRDLLKTKQGKQVIKECYNLIKNNKVLLEQFKIYDMFEKANNVEDAKDFVNEASNIVGKFDKKTVKENNEKLISLFKKHKLDEMVDISETSENLYEAIEYIITNNKNYSNINDFMKAQNTIVEYIENNKNTINENKVSMSLEEFEKHIESVDKEINENINEDEKELINKFLNNRNEDKKSIFEQYKRMTMKSIKKIMSESDETDKEHWNKIYEDFNKTQYSDNITENITNCAKMLETFNIINE